MKQFNNAITLCFLVLFCTCKSQKYIADQLPDKQLVFGGGGGIAGANNTYILLENGQLFHLDPLAETYTALKGIPKKEAASFFENLEKLALSQTDFDHPGNLYYFVEEVNGTEKHRVTWGSNGHQVDKDISALYKDLKTTIK